jgi:hypothetical protein
MKSINLYYFPFYIRHYVDVDYFNGLSDDDKDYMIKFLHEYYHTYYTSGKKSVHDSSYKKQNVDFNNATRRDIMNLPFNQRPLSKIELTNDIKLNNVIVKEKDFSKIKGEE